MGENKITCNLINVEITKVNILRCFLPNSVPKLKAHMPVSCHTGHRVTIPHIRGSVKLPETLVNGGRCHRMKAKAQECASDTASWKLGDSSFISRGFSYLICKMRNNNSYHGECL